MTSALIRASLVLFFAISATGAQAATGTFTDWIAADDALNTATGTLGTSTVTLTTTASVGLNGGGVIPGSTLGGGFSGFADPAFTPSIASTDGIVLASASSFSVAFAAPLLNPVLHLYQLANSTLTFSAPFTLLSSDGNFSTVTSNTIRGVADVSDANGSLHFAGTHASLSWTASDANLGDGFIIQISDIQIAAIPEPSTYVLLLAGLGLVGFAAHRRRTARPGP